VNVNHWGPFFWNNQHKWGWTHDKTNAPEAEEKTNGQARHDDSAPQHVEGTASGIDHTGIELRRGGNPCATEDGRVGTGKI
jgi:hypothetical protein